MNQAAQKHNPPSRMSKEELKEQNAVLAQQAADAQEQARLIGIENERMLQEYREMQQKIAGLQPNSTTSIASDTRLIDPVTNRPLNPALSQEELDAQDEQIGSTYDNMMEVEDAPIKPVETQRLARVAPASIRPSLMTDERDTGLHGKIQQFSDNRLGEDALVEHARNADIWAAKQKADNIAFMKQLVTIYIEHSNDRQADKMFSIGVNGRQWTFERNKEYTVPRYVVEGLLRAKPMAYGNEEYTKANGERDVRWPIHQGCRYPFAIVQDAYPKWREWMRYTMAQPD